MHPSFLSCLMGTYINWVLLFAWVLLFKKWIATGFMGTYIHRVLVFDGYLYSRVYGILIAAASEARVHYCLVCSIL